MSKSADIAITTVLTLLVVVTIVGNSVLCLIIKRHREMRVPINYLLVNLAVTDIIYAVFITPRIYFKLLFSHPDGVFGPFLCKFVTDGNIAWNGSGASFLTLAVIAIERYYAVLYPLSTKGKLTGRKLKVVIAASWIFGFIINFPLFLVEDIVKEKENGVKSCSTVWPEEWVGTAYNIVWSVVILLLLLVMAALYSRVVYTLWVKPNDDDQPSHQQRGVLKVRKRVTLMVVTVTAIFGICWGTTQIVYFLDVAEYNIGRALLSIVDTMVMFNSAANPFVYALLNRNFREKMKKMICCDRLLASRVQPGTSTNSMEIGENTTQPHTQPPTQQNRVQPSDVLN